MDELKSKVYILLDEDNNIIACEGGYTTSNIKEIDKWIKIDEGVGDKYNLCQSHYFPKPLYDENGLSNYKYVDKKIIEIDENDKNELLAKIVKTTQPSQLDAIEAQVMYTALMTDTLLESEV